MALPKLSGLARRLVNDQLLDEEKAGEYAECAQAEDLSFVSYIVGGGKVDGMNVAEAAADEFGSPLYDLSCHYSPSFP